MKKYLIGILCGLSFTVATGWTDDWRVRDLEVRMVRLESQVNDLEHQLEKLKIRVEEISFQKKR